MTEHFYMSPCNVIASTKKTFKGYKEDWEKYIKPEFLVNIINDTKRNRILLDSFFMFKTLKYLKSLKNDNVGFELRLKDDFLHLSVNDLNNHNIKVEFPLLSASKTEDSELNIKIGSEHLLMVFDSLPIQELKNLPVILYIKDYDYPMVVEIGQHTFIIAPRVNND